jgi:hypothetical protein
MAFINLRSRNDGVYELVNTDHIVNVWAKKADEVSYDEVKTNLYLSVQFQGRQELARYIPVEVDGTPDVEVSSPFEAIRALTAYIGAATS